MRRYAETARHAGQVFCRAWRLVAAPTAEWQAIAASLGQEQRLLRWHVVVLSALFALAWSLGVAWAPMQPGATPSYLSSVTTTFFLCVVAIMLLTLAIVLLLPMYERPRDWGRAWAVSAYSATPLLLCGMLLIVPILVIAMVVALPYAGYLLYIGLQEVLGARRGDAAEFAAAAMVAASLLSMQLGAALAALGVM